MEIIIDNFRLKPKARPRLNRCGRVYSPTRRHEESLAWLIKASMNYDNALVGEIDVDIIVSSIGNLPGDVDNYAKTVMDALEKAGIIANDRQIKSCRCRLREKSSTNCVVVAISDTNF